MYSHSFSSPPNQPQTVKCRYRTFKQFKFFSKRSGHGCGSFDTAAQVRRSRCLSRICNVVLRNTVLGIYKIQTLQSRSTSFIIKQHADGSVALSPDLSCIHTGCDTARRRGAYCVAFAATYLPQYAATCRTAEELMWHRSLCVWSNLHKTGKMTNNN